MSMINISYKIIESTPFDRNSPKTFWIKKETKLFGFTISSKIIGDYKIDDMFGELGWMPFFDKKETKKRIKLLK